ncbi:MAG TPA: hypothetical protein VIP46_04405 [Pyrinomonadaceae bacterium]
MFEDVGTERADGHRAAAQVKISFDGNPKCKHQLWRAALSGG